MLPLLFNFVLLLLLNVKRNSVGCFVGVAFSKGQLWAPGFLSDEKILVSDSVLFFCGWSFQIVSLCWLYIHGNLSHIAFPGSCSLQFQWYFVFLCISDFHVFACLTPFVFHYSFYPIIARDDVWYDFYHFFNWNFVCGGQCDQF